MRQTLIFLVILTGIITAQKPDSTLNKWIPSMVAGLNISQIAFKDWTKGGDNSITWTLIGDFNVLRKSEDWNFSSRLKAAYGRTKVSDNELRTNDNDFFFEMVAALKLGWAVDPFFSNTVRTQITSGFDYKVNPAVQITDFFDPGYITQSIGFTYDKLKIIKSRLGLAAQEVFTNIYTKYSDKPETIDVERFRFETGIESVTDSEILIDHNVVLKSMLRLFSRFESLDVWDIRWDNVITAKVNNWLNVNFSYLLIYEKAQSFRTQMKEALQIGIVYRII
ncbi:MAG: hypothetical protein C0412_06100 [Flavobacterium sp.]|nr:hypothetical protein [Flavobacterium sp.]